MGEGKQQSELDKKFSEMKQTPLKIVEPLPETNEKVIKNAEKLRKEQLKKQEESSRAKTIWDQVLLKTRHG